MTFDASDITIAVLTGRRPELLRRTLNALPDWLWTSAHTVVLHNSGDGETTEVLDDYKIDLKYTNLDGLWSIGRASSHIFQIAQAEARPFTMYVQDDWKCKDQSSEWLITALQILDDDPHVGAVRLRRTDERTMVNSMARGKTVTWSQHEGFRVSRQAVWCLNPFLMRTHELIFPIEDERDGMRKFNDWGQSVAQLTPGVFAHIGYGGKSLRQKVANDRLLRP